jgi:hypothetical protein
MPHLALALALTRTRTTLQLVRTRLQRQLHGPTYRVYQNETDLQLHRGVSHSTNYQRYS